MEPFKRDDAVTISVDTFQLLLQAMLAALEAMDRDSQVPGYDLALMPAMLSALDGDKEQVLRDVAQALAPSLATEAGQ